MSQNLLSQTLYTISILHKLKYTTCPLILKFTLPISLNKKNFLKKIKNTRVIPLGHHRSPPSTPATPLLRDNHHQLHWHVGFVFRQDVLLGGIDGKKKRSKSEVVVMF